MSPCRIACWVRFIIVLLACATGVPRLHSQSAAGSSAQAPGLQPATRPKFATDRLLVRFKHQAGKSDREQAHARVGGTVLRNYRIVPDLQLISLPPGSMVADAIRNYRSNPSVLYAEPDYVRSAHPLNPNDPRFVNGEQWNLHNTGLLGGLDDADIDAPEAWDITTGSATVYVGIIDTGINTTHPDLTANVAQLESNCSDGLDNDGNGFIDDCRGLNAILGNSNVADDHSHGTHVAGIVGATGNNGVGVTGVNWTVRLIACKFLDADGFGADSDAIECLQYFHDLKVNRGINLVATNNSWGGPGFSQALYDAVQTHISGGILFVAAAGNAGTNNDVQPDVPSSFFLPNVIAVASTTRTDTRSDFSNFGRQTVHLGAPGSEIVSTVPPALNSGSSYASFNGTSMASPHVAGVAALLKAADNNRDYKAIRNLILAGGDGNPHLASTVTGKRLNAFGALMCSGRVLQSRLRPIGPATSAVPGSPLPLAMLNIDCANPNGNPVVTVSPGGGSITLLDDGAGTDQVAGDGVYSGQFTLPSPGTFTLTFPGGDVVTVASVTRYGFSPTAFSYRTITGNNLVLGDDDSAPVTSPFPVQFGGAAFNTIHVSSNGALSFDGPFTPFVNQPLPFGNFATLVAPFWDDLYPGPSAEQNIFWQILGSAPTRELVIEWRNVSHFDLQGPDGVRFQVVFFEGSSNILFNYADVFFTGPTFRDRGGSATVGVQVGSSTATQFSHDAQSLSDNLALLWQVQNTPNPVPNATSLSPPSVDEYGPDFELTVTGSDFLSISRVRWNGVDRPTTFVSATELRAAISANLILGPASAAITVFTPAPGGGESAALNFFINDIPDNPHPSLLSISPDTTAAGGPEFTLTVNGHNFSPSSVVRWQGNALPTSFVGPEQLTALVPASLITMGQYAVINVSTPPPGGGDTAGIVLVVNDPVPSLGSISPTSIGAGAGGLTLTVNGTNFASTSLVQWNAVTLVTVYVNSGQLVAGVAAGEILAPGTATVTVITPPPGGGTSDSALFTITDFTLGADPSTRTVNAGSSATYNITLTPQGGSFSNAINLSCSAGLPSRASCSFQPVSVTPGAANAASTLTITTAAQTSALAVPLGATPGPVYAAFLTVPAMLWIGTLSRIRRGRRLGYFLAGLLLAGMMAHTACGGGGSSSSTSRPPTITPGTPPGSYTITVRAVSGSLERTTTVTLVVQ